MLCLYPLIIPPLSAPCSVCHFFFVRRPSVRSTPPAGSCFLIGPLTTAMTVDCPRLPGGGRLAGQSPWPSALSSLGMVPSLHLFVSFFAFYISPQVCLHMHVWNDIGSSNFCKLPFFRLVDFVYLSPLYFHPSSTVCRKTGMFPLHQSKSTKFLSQLTI